MAKIKVRITEELPICPYCKKEISEILLRQNGLIFISSIYMCPHCKSFLGSAKENLL